MELAAATWIERVPAVDVSTRVLEWDLGGGEASVIELALRTPGAEVVIDDLAGRRCALAMGLRVHGILGVVIESHRLGKLTDPRATMLELRENGMWISDAVIERALQIAMRHK